MSLYPGVYKLTFGKPEQHTPVSLRTFLPCHQQLNQMSVADCPIQVKSFCSTGFGIRLTLPLLPSEHIYGFGLQLKSFEQTGKKRLLRTNADPVQDSGDSHAPVPFYLSTDGYGIFVDSCRPVTFYCGTNHLRDEQLDTVGQGRAGSPEALYSVKKLADNVTIDVASVEGVNLYIFAGPTMKQALARYNLFSGGGPDIPLWGLGFMYRCHVDSNEEQVLALAKHFREQHIPCDIIGLEPGWQTHAYPCTFEWDKLRFPTHVDMLTKLKASGYHINLWEHAFVDTSSTLFEPMRPFSGDYLVWNGLVPDFADKRACDIFAEHQYSLIAQGVDGFKLDECDGSDYTGGWFFPECTCFPSGLDGQQMHTMYGTLFQQTVLNAFASAKQKTWGQVRAAQALAAPYPFVLYSDLYDQRDFLRGLATSGFSGLLWSPEVRQTDSAEEYIRRLQTVICSPLALVNAWMIKNPPWEQYRIAENNAENLLPESEKAWLTGLTRSILSLRMSLAPYLYHAFYQYRHSGIPPVRALVLDDPQNSQLQGLDDQVMLGDNLMAAPVIYGEGNLRKIYLPHGQWYDFYTHKSFAGGQWLERNVPLEELPLYVREGTLLPLATPCDYLSGQTLEINLLNFGGKSCHASLVCSNDAEPDAELRVLNIYATAHGYNISADIPAEPPQYKVVSYTVIN